MWHIISVGGTLLIAGLVYFWLQLVRRRREVSGLPCPPLKNFLLGHLLEGAEFMRLFPPSSHPHNHIRYMQKKYSLSKYFYVDYWPLGPRFLFISDPEMLAQYVTTQQVLPKSTLMTGFLDILLGPNNMVGLEGSHWKMARSMFNPGFAASHLVTLVPYIVDSTSLFCGIIRQLASTNELFRLEDAATKLTIDVIGKVVLDSDFNSQKDVHPIVKTFQRRIELMPAVSSSAIDLTDFEYIRRIKAWFNNRTLNRLIAEEVDRKISAHAANLKSGNVSKSFKDRKRSVVDLALDSYHSQQLGDSKTQNGNAATIDPTFLRYTIDNVKTFIFAGHDTTASTISYVFYALHFRPHVHKKVIDELDEVFGPDSTGQSIAETLKNQPHKLNQLEYINAVIKETLRIFPPASGLRYSPLSNDPNKNLFMTDPKTGQKLPLSGWHVWAPPVLVHRNEEYFPRPVEFIPERFIPSQNPFPEAKLSTPAGKEAWRPFERGPRNCIGQELAMMEMKLVVAMTAKEFDFVPEFDGQVVPSWNSMESVDEYSDGVAGKKSIEGSRCYQILKGAAKPCEGMPGRMKLRSQKNLGSS